MNDELKSLLNQIAELRAIYTLNCYGIMEKVVAEAFSKRIVVASSTSEHLLLAKIVASYLSENGMPMSLCDCCVETRAPHEHFTMTADVRALLILKYGSIADMYRTVIPLALGVHYDSVQR